MRTTRGWRWKVSLSKVPRTWGMRFRLGLYAMLLLIGAVAVAEPLRTPATAEDPTGGAGLFAPVIAMCVALMFLTQATHDQRSSLIRRLVSSATAIGSYIAAYYWLADEAGMHPSGPDLLRLSVALFVAAIPVGAGVVWLLASLPDGQPHSSDDDA